MGNYVRKKKSKKKGSNQQLLEPKIESPEELLDELALYQEWRAEILPQLRNMAKSKLPPKKMYEEFKHLLTARMLSMALTEKDSAKAMAAISKLEDRHIGKPTENKNIRHELADIEEDQLDSLIISLSKDLDEDEEHAAE